MKLTKDQTVLQSFGEAIQFEWLETNGLGGWAGSSLTGCNTRRYHGLLVAATRPPTERMALVSKLDETLISKGQRFELGSNLYPGGVRYPEGQQYLREFSRKYFPEWIYEAGGICLRKTIAMVHGENTSLIRYQVLEAEGPFQMELLPMISARGYHSLQHAGSHIWWDVQFENGIFRNRPFESAPEIFISVPGSSYRHQPGWFYKFNYPVEQYRGQDFEEDLFNHGKFLVELKPGDSLGIILSTENPSGREVTDLMESERRRRSGLLVQAKIASVNESDLSLSAILTLAADQFIVKRGEDLKTIIAGYHWFTDWGRDTMISLPGLCLASGRLDDARKIIEAFAKSSSQGMLPNRFQDNQEPPEYNNVDGTLWYFIAIYRYMMAGGDQQFILDQILPVLGDMIDWHFRGTRYNIHVDEEGLLFAGEKGQQLTWMDARIGDWVVTPRIGRPVEVQALWYNALLIYSQLLSWKGDREGSGIMARHAEKARISFNKRFWNPEGNYLFDNIDELGQPDPTLRPNQLFAISLPFVLLQDPEQSKSVMKVVEEKLYTPAGLRSLTPDDIHYVGTYGGNAYQRDSSYHEGTVWTWLLGPYVDAVIRVYGKQEGRDRAGQIIADFSYHLQEACIGSVSEIMDAEGSHHPRGCVAQAWAVAEILRVIREYDLEPKPRPEPIRAETK